MAGTRPGPTQPPTLGEWSPFGHKNPLSTVIMFYKMTFARPIRFLLGADTERNLDQIPSPTTFTPPSSQESLAFLCKTIPINFPLNLFSHPNRTSAPLPIAIHCPRPSGAPGEGGGLEPRVPEVARPLREALLARPEGGGRGASEGGRQMESKGK